MHGGTFSTCQTLKRIRREPSITCRCPWGDAISEVVAMSRNALETAGTTDKIAWVLCQIIADDAPLNWERYRFVANCIASNADLMANLNDLRHNISKQAKEQT